MLKKTYSPQYIYIQTLVNHLNQIERLYGQLESLHIPKKLQLNLERNNLVQSSYISNSIEGNSLSLPEVTNLLLDERVPVNRDEKEVKNYFNLLQDLPEIASEPLVLETILQIHAELMAGVDDAIAGQIRDTRVVVGGYLGRGDDKILRIKHEPPTHSRPKIKKKLEQLLHWYYNDDDTPAILKAGIFHHQYVYIHPFEDGNGRTCRLLTALTLLQAGYQINKYFVLDDYYDLDRANYSNMLNSADQGDKTQWLTYFAAGVMYSLQSALGKIEQADLMVQINERPTPREREVLALLKKRQQLTSAELAEKLNVSRQQAHKLLVGLVEKGFARQVGKTKGSYYEVE